MDNFKTEANKKIKNSCPLNTVKLLSDLTEGDKKIQEEIVAVRNK